MLLRKPCHDTELSDSINPPLRFCHLSPTGGRLDKNGNECVPPAGYGAQAAFEGVEKVLQAQGEPQHAVVADETPAPSDEQSGATSGKAAAGTGATPPSDTDLTTVHQPASPGTMPNGDPPRSDEMHEQMQGLRVDEDRSVTSRSSVDVPVAKTAPGPPASGPVLFDHPPSQEEKKQAEELLARTGRA